MPAYISTNYHIIFELDITFQIISILHANGGTEI